MRSMPIIQPLAHGPSDMTSLFMRLEAYRKVSSHVAGVALYLIVYRIPTDEVDHNLFQ